MKSVFVASAFLVGVSSCFAQDILVNSLKLNASDKSKENFKFTEVINLGTTSVKSQGSSGTCWSYSTNSFLESEMIRLGKQPVELSQIFSARNVYVEKGVNYVRMHGAISLGDGGALHDVINMYKKYGTVPREVYTGLNYGTDKNKFGEMGALIEAVLAAVVKNPNGELTPNWQKAYAAVIDSYLGKVPDNFNYKGKNYTPQSFAKEVVGINPDDYIEFSNYKDSPYYQKMVLPVPDNWSYDQLYNVPMTELTDIIDYALDKGYTVAWSSDVSEPYFSWKNGVAFVPNMDLYNITDEQKKTLFDGPMPEKDINEDIRLEGLYSLYTTDDHAMQIVGSAKDQNGRTYYKVKNSWGETNDYKGYLYVTKAFVQLKSTGIVLHKNGISKTLKNKLK